jgi:hypothetical protein
MPRKSTDKSSVFDNPPRFKSEAEEAEWLSSPAVRRAYSQRFQKAMESGNVIVNESRTLSAELKEKAKRTGAVIINKNGLDVKRSNPAVVEELVDRVKAKQTQSVSLRISIADLEAAKKLAEKAGIGYQTVLKDLIHEGLRRAL